MPDACFGLPWLFLQLVCKRHLEIARECAPYRLGNLFQIKHPFQVAAMRPAYSCCSNRP